MYGQGGPGGYPVSPMFMSGARMQPGTQRQMQTLQDIPVGATVICVRAGSPATQGQEYTVTAITPQRVDFEGKNRKYNMKPMDFMQFFNRRLGPIVEEAIRKGMSARATFDGKHYRAGDIITLTEASGRIFDFKDVNGRRGSVERQELLTAFIFV